MVGTSRVAALCVVLAALTVPAVAGADGALRATAVQNGVEDPKGDVQNENGAAVSQPEADIVRAAAEHRGGDVVFTVLVDRPTDPSATKNWEGATMAAWAVETNGDDQTDFLVAFGRDDAGQPAAKVARLNGEDAGADACSGTASRGPQGEYVATVPAGCLGDPASHRYAAAMTWDTDPANENAPAVGDTAPDGGNPAGPVTKP